MKLEPSYRYICIYVIIYIYTWKRVCMYAFVIIYIHACMHTYMHPCIYRYRYAYYICVSVHMFPFIFLGIYKLLEILRIN